MYYFLKKDFEALNAEIERIADKIGEIRQRDGKNLSRRSGDFP